MTRRSIDKLRELYLCLSPTRQDLTQGQWPEGRSTSQESYICVCLPPDRTWHKVNDPKVDRQAKRAIFVSFSHQTGLDTRSMTRRSIDKPRELYLCLSPTRQDLTQGQWPEGRSTSQESYIYVCLPPDRTWHKVNDPKVDRQAKRAIFVSFSHQTGLDTRSMTRR